MLGIGKLLREKLAKTKNQFIGKIAEAVNLRGKVDEELMLELEEILIQADIGGDLSSEIIDELRTIVRYEKTTSTADVASYLQTIIEKILSDDTADNLNPITEKPHIMLVIGVNGVGKTTTVGKLAARFFQEGKKVLIIAADTFRAAASEQLEIWAKRSQADFFAKEAGSDPSSVVYDGLKNATAYDIVMIDTAGRQHNRANLMKELDKIQRTIKKVYPLAPHETLLVIDATTGQNAISQAKLFNEIAPLTGLVLTKLDGTAKGGIVLAIKRELKIPVKLIGVGEKIEHLVDFNAAEFAAALFAKE